jgi:uncharacterized protein YbjT (DUF2867 family)
MILVIGGRSKIGSALIDELVQQGEPVRALARSGKAESLPDEVEAVRGDLGDRASLDAAMDGARRVFLLSGPHPDEVSWHRNAIDAAKDAGVELLVRSSILGADPASQSTFARDHGAVDGYLAKSGVPHVVLHPNLFQQNVPETTIPSIDPQGTFYANAGEARVSMVDTRDVAAVAAAVLTGSHRGSAHYDVTGPEALSYADVAGKLSTYSGRRITYVDVPDEAVRETLRGFGVGEWLVGALVDLYQDYKRSGADGYAAQVTNAVAELTGRPPRTLDQLLDESGSAIKGDRTDVDQ